MQRMGFYIIVLCLRKMLHVWLRKCNGRVSVERERRGTQLLELTTDVVQTIALFCS